MPRPMLSRVLVGTLLLPAVFGALVLWSLADRAGQADRVPAAVVNLDEPVTKGEGENKQVIAAGRLLAAGLTQPRPSDTAHGSNLGWELTTPEDAETGLREGGYYAVVTIPEDFSETLASVTGDHPRSAAISVRSNDSSSALVGQISRQVADVAAARLGDRVTATYLKGLFDRSDELRLELGRASDAAGKVADGATLVEDGATRLDDGASRLVGGLGQLSAGAGKLGSGASRLAEGASKLNRGTGRLASGADRIDAGARRLAGGLDTLRDRTRDLPHHTDRLADGADRVADGVAPYTELVAAWKDACLTDPVVAAARPQLCTATIRAAGARGENARKLREGARGVADGARRLATGMPALTDGLGRAADGAGRLSTGTSALAAGAERLVGGTERLAAGAAALSGGAGKLAGGAETAGAGATRLADGSARLADGSAKLSSGSSRLATGLADGAGRIPDADRQAARVVADPVATRASSLNPARDGATILTPVVLAFGLWLGAFVTYLVRRALPARGLRAARAAWRVTMAGWLPAVLIGLLQAALLLSVSMALGASFTSPFGVGAMLLVCSAAFAAVNQTFVAVLGPRRGWIAAIAFAALQGVSIGGLVPIDTAPGPLQVLNGVLPVARAADGFAHLTLGGQVGSPFADGVVVALWGLAALVATTTAARRRQRVTLSDVRREVSVTPSAA